MYPPGSSHMFIVLPANAHTFESMIYQLSYAYWDMFLIVRWRVWI